MVIELKDPTTELKNRKREIDMMSPHSGVDDKETKEREEAAARYAGENEQHFVDYCMDCIKTSVKANEGIRKTQSACWEVYNEKEPFSYADKEAWQAKTILPKPFQTVQFGKASIKKAFSPQFLSIENSKNKKAGDFWQKMMETQLDKSHAKFLMRFPDATEMSLAVGISMEMIVRWIVNKGLDYSLVEPWKIHRDPDAVSRDPQSGMYWIHQEWLDYAVLKEGENKGRYFDVDRVKDVTEDNTDNPLMSKEAIAARKKMIWKRSQFRKSILTSEFWGIVLDPRGEIILPNATYTVSGGRVIQLPKKPLYKRLRWPGISFSPMPDILRHGGHGLMEGILTIWEAMNNILCLHEDYLKWLVNPPREINVDGLVDTTDVETWPGKGTLVKDTVSGQQVIRTEQRRSRTNDVLANLKFYDQIFQGGSFMPDVVQGLPGYRQDITFREKAMNLDQSLSVYGLMGENIEDGAVNAIIAGVDVVESQAGYNDYLDAFTQEELIDSGIEPDIENGIKGVPEFDGTFHVSGIQALLREAESLRTLKEVMIPLSERPAYASYMKPYKILKAIEERTKLTDEGIVATEDEAKLIGVQMRLAQAKQTDAVEKLQELQDAIGITDLVKKLQDIEAPDINTMADKIKDME